MLIDFSTCTYMMSLMCDTVILSRNYKLELLWFIEIVSCLCWKGELKCSYLITSLLWIHFPYVYTYTQTIMYTSYIPTLFKFDNNDCTYKL